MSASLSTTLRPAVTEQSGAVSRLISTSRHWVARYFARRDAIASLRELDDAALQDIGLARSQIEAAVRGLITRPARPRGR